MIHESIETQHRHIARAASAALIIVASAYGCVRPTEPSTDIDGQQNVVLEALTPTELTAPVTSAIDPAPTIRIRTETGQPIAGVPVFFVLSGPEESKGQVGTGAVFTDRDGIARTTWRLGTRSGIQRLTATSPGLRNMVFSAGATPGPPSRLSRRTVPPALGIAGVKAWNCCSVLVADQYGNPVSRVIVTFTTEPGNGSVANASVSTDETGTAHSGIWILGSPGINVVRASVADLPALEFAVEAVEMPQPAFKLESITLGSSDVRFSGAIGLSDQGTFVTHVEGLVGLGTYSVKNLTIVFTYSNAFLDELMYRTWYMPQFGSVEFREELGKIDGSTLVLSRCWTEDCYESTWVFRR